MFPIVYLICVVFGIVGMMLYNEYSVDSWAMRRKIKNRLKRLGKNEIPTGYYHNLDCGFYLFDLYIKIDRFTHAKDAIMVMDSTKQGSDNYYFIGNGYTALIDGYLKNRTFAEKIKREKSEKSKKNKFAKGLK